jgi:hypothetical protein
MHFQYLPGSSGGFNQHFLIGSSYWYQLKIRFQDSLLPGLNLPGCVIQAEGQAFKYCSEGLMRIFLKYP